MKFLMSMPRLTNSQAHWDLGTLGERKSTGDKQFFSFTEEKMLRFTLPIQEKEGEVIAHETQLKTIRLFLIKPQDFRTAIHYLSRNAGLRQRYLKGSANHIDADAARNSQSVPRPQIARPRSAFAPSNLTQKPPRSRTADPLHERVPPQGHLRGPSLPQVSKATQGSSARDRFSQPRRFPSRNSSAVVAGDRTPLYERPVRHDRLDDQSANRADQVLSSAGRTIGTTAPLFDKHPSPWQTPEILPSRSPSVSERGVPLKIQVLGLPDDSNYSYSHPNIRWEFVLHLLPSTKIYELCLHAASYIRRKYDSVVDGRELAAQGRNGTIFADQDSLSEEILQGGALILLERRLLGLIQPVPTTLSELYSNPSPQGSRPELGKLYASHPTSSEDPSSPAVDELDQVPPPRPLPFQLVGKHGPPRSSSSTIPDQSPLAEKPDLLNTSIGTRADAQTGQPVGQNKDTKIATKKQPSRQKRPLDVPRRAASSAGGSKLDSDSAPKQPTEPRTLARRPETSLGIRPKRKKLSSDTGVSAAMPPVMDSAHSGAKVSQRGPATPACVNCRIKKRECDRVEPICGACLKDNGPCAYLDSQETAATGSTADKAYKGHRTETVAHPAGLRSQAVTSSAATSDALTQTSYSRESRDTATQTQLVEHGKQDVDMVDVGTEPCSLYIDDSTETDRCNDIWFPFSQCAEVMIWAGRRSEEQIEKAAEVLKTTDPSHEDYRSKVEQAAMYAVEFEKEIRDKCEEILRRG